MSFHGYKGQRSAAAQKTSSRFSQASTRHNQGSYDQHGRHWSWSADNRSGMPASLVAPDFSAPWYPDPQYIIINPDNTNEAYIDYPALFRDRKAAMSGYHREAVRYAQRRQQQVPKIGQYTDDIVEAIGLPPRALELIAAAAQEHPWVLGNSDIEDPRLVPFLETPSSDLERELEEFDFSIDSYEREVGLRAGTAPKQSPTAPQRPKKFKSLAELEAAAADLPVGEGVAEEDEELDPTEADENADAMSEFDEVDEDDVDTEIESIPTEDEGAESRADETEIVLEDDEDDALQSLEDEHDPEARGGQRVRPGKQDIAARQAARRPTQTAKARKKGAARSAGAAKAPEEPKASTRTGPRPFDRSKHQGRTLADGAKPFVGDATRSRT